MTAPPPPRVPPRFVPTLTEVVQSPGAAQAPAVPEVSQEQLVQRVMQRVQLGLDQRLREAVAQVVLDHTRHLAPALANEAEQVLRAMVAEALAEERSR